MRLSSKGLVLYYDANTCPVSCCHCRLRGVHSAEVQWIEMGNICEGIGPTTCSLPGFQMRLFEIWCVLTWCFLKAPLISSFLLPPQKTSLTSKCCDCQKVQPEIGFHDWYISENLIWITGAFYQACAAPLKVNEQCGCPANRDFDQPALFWSWSL